MRDQIGVVGILWMILGGLTILGAIALAVFGGGGVILGLAGHDRDAATAGAIVGGIMGVIAVFIFVMGLAAFIAGNALRKYRPWARIAVIVLSILNLLSFPIGTAIGVYSLVVLFNDDAAAAFR